MLGIVLLRCLTRQHLNLDLSASLTFNPVARNETIDLFADFDRQKWFAILENYGVDGKHFDDDDLLIPKLVTELICPIVLHGIQVLFTFVLSDISFLSEAINLSCMLHYAGSCKGILIADTHSNENSSRYDAI